jgi:hypothetical protein
VDSFRLEAITEIHPLAVQLFVPFAVARLQEHPKDTEAILTIELRDIEGTIAAERELRLFWESASIPQSPLAVQGSPLTEWAALGVSCALIWHFAGLRLHAVAAEGDRFDYWVMRETQEFALEVSGTTAADLEARHREKIHQLCSNPYSVAGFVVVVGFGTGSVSKIAFSAKR